LLERRRADFSRLRKHCAMDFPGLQNFTGGDGEFRMKIFGT